MDVLVLPDLMLGDLALVQLRGVQGMPNVPRLKRGTALERIRARLRDPIDGPRLRAFAAELTGNGAMLLMATDEAVLAEFDRALSPPERLLAVPMNRPWVPPPPAYAGPSIGPAPRPPRPAPRVIDPAIQRLAMEEKVRLALEQTKKTLGPAFAQQIEGLLSGENLAIISALLVVWGAGHAFGVSEIVDALLLLVGIVMLGTAAIDVAEKLIRAFGLIADAANRAELNQAGDLLAEAIAIIGVTALLELVVWMAARRGVSRGRKGGRDAPPPPPPDPPPPPRPSRPPESPPKPRPPEPKPPEPPKPRQPTVEQIDVADVRYSQNTAGGNGRADVLRESMRKNGYSGEPIDVVRTPDGLVTLDNTRPAVAREMGIDKIPARVHQPGDPLPPDMIGRFGDAKTWGEAAAQRAANQRPPLPPTGSPNPPRLPKPKNPGPP